MSHWLHSRSTTAAPAQAQPNPVLRAPGAPAVVRSRLTLPSGIMTGEASTHSVVIWSRSSGDGKMIVRVQAMDENMNPLRGKHAYDRTVTSGWVTAATDHTCKLGLTGLPAGTAFLYTVHFADDAGHRSQPEVGTFRTAPEGLPGGHGRDRGRGRGSGRGEGAGNKERGQSFVWTADTAGQGWGINEELGGMLAYRAMAATNPDFFIHAGDTVYSDNPIEEKVTETDEQVWRNLVVEGVHKVAETQEEFRVRHRYNMMDRNIRAFYADVPLLAQWDDHETTNNWYPGEILEDDRYSITDVDRLARRARRAWQEYQPIGNARALAPGTSGFEDARIYRSVDRGRQLEVFCLDMRTHKSPNTSGTEAHETQILGEEQTRWLIDGLKNSRATWKCISADLPLGLVVPDGQAQESISNADPGLPLGREMQLARVLKSIKDNDVKNVFVVTGDVHYCAAHHYSPDRAAFQDFTEFWEFVAGPIHAGAFGPNDLDATFGPQQVFEKHGPTGASPRNLSHQFFGHVDIDSDDVLTVSLRDGHGSVVWSKTFEPQGV